MLVIVRIVWPGWFTRLVTVPARCRWRWWWCYRRRWRAVLTIAGLGPKYRGQVTLPVLGKVQAGRCADLVAVRLVSGQSPKLFADRAEELAHGFGAHSCRVRTARPGRVVLEFVRRDALAAVIPALPIPAVPDLRALPVGRCEDGVGVHDPAARHAPAHRRVDRGGERLLPVGPGPRPAARDGGRAGAGACL